MEGSSIPDTNRPTSDGHPNGHAGGQNGYRTNEQNHSNVICSSNENSTETNGFVVNEHMHLNGNGSLNATLNGDCANGNLSSPAPKEVEPIAIIGISCRTSGNVSSAEELWQMCSRARSGWSQVPKERWSHQGYFHPNAAKTGTINAEGGHFIQEDVALFDAPFFNISASEAKSIDPQQRLLLECTYEAFENAGIPKENIVGKNVGVFVGGSFSDYSLYCLRDVDVAPPYEGTGTAQSVLANRLSYYFDLKGPSFTVDTACSSTMSALHLACQSIKSGESHQAVVAGAHLNLVPDMYITMSNLRIISREGTSRSFDDSASGFGRGEGVGCIVLKRLKDAIPDGDRIRAVIRNTGMNQDGRTQGLSMPNGQAQAELVRSVYDSAGLDPLDTGYIEAHGTGTKVGDPIEAKALHSVFGAGRSSKDCLYVGSLKSNIGHTEGASGILSVIKAALMLEKGFVLPNIHFKKANEDIPLGEWNMKVPKSQLPWPRKKRYASVNNFGFGGTNCHVVLEGPPKPTKAERTIRQQPNHVAQSDLLNGIDPGQVATSKIGIGSHKFRFSFTLSAHSEKSVREQMKDLQMYLEQRPETLELSVMGKLAYTLCQRRSKLPCKIALTATTSSELIAKLSNPDLKPLLCFAPPKVSFVFTGQGAQWYAMGRELMGIYPKFASTIELCDRLLRELGAEWSLKAELSKNADTTLVGQAYISQPACTAIQIALVVLLASWNVHPGAVIGHSSGEIAAAFAAGAFSIDCCMKIAYHRGLATMQFKRQFPDLRGSMIAVGAASSDILPLLDGLKSGTAGIACINSPSSITASGDEAAIDELQKLVEDKRIFNRKLRVDMAYHSHHMELVAEDYLNAVSDIKLRDTCSEVKFFSSVTGSEIGISELGAAYWVKNLVSVVNFGQALQEMCTTLSRTTQQESLMLIEVGPHGALEGPIKQTLKATGNIAKDVYYAPSLVRQMDATEAMHELGCKLFSKGLNLNLESVNFPRGRDKTASLLTDLPRYPWNHNTRYWHESRIGENHLFIRQFPRNDILGAYADDSNDLEPRWRNIIRLADMPWLRDHQIQSNIVFPMAGYVTMAMEAAYQRASSRNVKFDRYEFREISANRALLIDESTDVETMITLRPYNEGTRKSTDTWDEFRIFAWSSGKGWVEHCRGLVTVQKDKIMNEVDGQWRDDGEKELLRQKIATMNEACRDDVDISLMASNLQNLGIYYGPAFQSFTECRTAAQFAVGEVELADIASMMPHKFEPELIMHPAHLDLVIQILWPLLGAGRQGYDKIYMPSGFKRLSISPRTPKTPGSRLRVFGTSPPLSSVAVKPVDLNVFATHESNPYSPCVILEGYTVTPVHHDTGHGGADSVRKLCYKMDWEPYERIHTDSVTGFSDMDVTLIYDGHTDYTTTLQSALEGLTGKLPDLSSLANIIPDNRYYIILNDMDKPFLNSLSSESFAQLQSVIVSAKGLLWVTRSAYQNSISPTGNMAIGLARTVRSETGLRFPTLDLDESRDIRSPETTKLILDTFIAAFDPSAGSDRDMEFSDRDGTIYIPRIIDDEEMSRFVHQQLRGTDPEPQPLHQGGRPLKMTIGSHGLLDTMHFIDDYTLEGVIPKNYVEIEVKAVGLNFKDIMIAMGHLSNEHIGVECSGIVTQVGSAVTDLKPGDRVCAMAEGSFATYIRCKETSVAAIEDGMSFETASTMPVVWCTAYYALMHVARLEKDESILIHAAAGGVGQCAIILSQMIGAKIFVTVGSAIKKAYIADQYGISEDHIFYSRDTSFASQIQRATNGIGVDVVLNSLAGDSLLATWQCMASFGRFVEIGKRDIVTNTRLEMSTFARNLTFSSVDLVVVDNERPALMKRLLRDVFELHRKGIVRPITPLSVHSISDVEAGFRSLQSGKNLGKISISMSDKDAIVQAIPAKLSDGLLKADGSYLIVGGTGGIGRSLTRWMASKGAKRILLASRSLKISESVQSVIQEMAVAGTEVVVEQCDVSQPSEVESLISKNKDIRGIIHSAMVLNDILFEKMTYADYDSVVKPKVAGAWNLHNSLSKHQLDFFIMLSSAAGTIGNKGQAAYSAANTFMNAFAQYRARQGLPATSIDLAAVSDVGYLAENTAKKDLVMNSIGSGAVNEAEIHALIAAAICNKMSSSCSSHCITGLDLAPGSQVPSWMGDPKFTGIRPTVDAATSANVAVSLRESLKVAISVEEAETMIYKGLENKVSTMLLIPMEDIDGRQPISSYGLDSLVAVEFRNWITKQTDANLQVLELLSSGSLISLSQNIVKKSGLLSPLLLRENGAKGSGE